MGFDGAIVWVFVNDDFVEVHFFEERFHPRNVLVNLPEIAEHLLALFTLPELVVLRAPNDPSDSLRWFKVQLAFFLLASCRLESLAFVHRCTHR